MSIESEKCHENGTDRCGLTTFTSFQRANYENDLLSMLASEKQGPVDLYPIDFIQVICPWEALKGPQGAPK